MSKEYYKNFTYNQYEDYNNGVFLYGEKVKARYIEQSEPTYKGNSLIEALPPIKTDEQIFDEFYNAPIYSDKERNMSDEYRKQAIYRLMDYTYPISKNFEIQYYLDIVIRRGYVSKRIFSQEHIKKLKATSTCLYDDNNLKGIKEMVCLRSNLSKPSSGFLIFGISGQGKSTSIEKSLSVIPQVIIHQEDGSLFTQITWIKIDCTYNGGIKGICQKFFAKIDSLLGKDYLRMYGKQTFGIDRMIIAMAHLAQLYALGVLIIDEIQHLRGSNRSNNDGENTLNFFVSMMNEINLPIVYIGTYKAVKTDIGKDFRHGRRATGIADVDWGVMENDTEWDMFIEDMWKYQWVRNKSSLTKEIKDSMYENTLGITDRIVKLYMSVQLNAIVNGNEAITPGLIKKVANEKFILTKSMIEALKTKNLQVLSGLEDLCSPSFKELVDDSHMTNIIKTKVKELAMSEMQNRKVKKGELVNDITVAVANLGYDYEKIVKIVKDVVDRYGIKKDINFLKREVTKLLLLQDEDSSAEAAKTQKDPINNKIKKPKKYSSEEIDEFKNDNVKDIFEGVINQEE
jgi:hypothetical protein